ncbi:MAG: hypothetical protein WCP14_00160 [bacterium]
MNGETPNTYHRERLEANEPDYREVTKYVDSRLNTERVHGHYYNYAQSLEQRGDIELSDHQNQKLQDRLSRLYRPLDVRYEELNHKRILEKRSEDAYKLVFTYFGSNEAWFGDNSIVLQVSDAEDQFRGIDSFLEISARPEQPDHLGIDFTTSAKPEILEGKLTKGLDRLQNLRTQELIGKIRYNNEFVAADSFPIVLALGAKNTDKLIHQVAEEIKKIPENPLHKISQDEYPEKVGITGLEGGRESKIPFIMNFIQQITAQLELYKMELGAKPVSERQNYLLERLNTLLKYFSFLQNAYESHYDFVPLYDRSSEALISIVNTKVASQSL